MEKGKAGSGVGHAQKTPLQGLRFETLEQAQASLDRWETHWADTRTHGTTKRQVAAMFAEERPALQPLPVEPFRYYRFGVRTVHLDGCVEVEAACYSTPPGWIGQRVQVQWTDLHVRVLAPTGPLLREHLQAPRGWHQIADPDRPARTPASTTTLLAGAQHAGPHLQTVCTYIYDHEGPVGVRRILGVLALAKQYGPPQRTRRPKPRSARRGALARAVLQIMSEDGRRESDEMRLCAREEDHMELVTRIVFVLVAALALWAVPSTAGAHGGNNDPQFLHVRIGNVSKVVRGVGASGVCITGPPVIAETADHWRNTGEMGDKGDNGTNGINGINGASVTFGGHSPVPRTDARMAGQFIRPGIRR